eukprot:361084-Chlamydomonas_euryale.AAC.1
MEWVWVQNMHGCVDALSVRHTAHVQHSKRRFSCSAQQEARRLALFNPPVALIQTIQPRQSVVCEHESLGLPFMVWPLWAAAVRQCRCWHTPSIGIALLMAALPWTWLARRHVAVPRGCRRCS